MRIQQDVKAFVKGGMDSELAPQYVEPNDYIEAWNYRNEGVEGNDFGNSTGVESTVSIPIVLPEGDNIVIGSRKFDTAGKAYTFRYNSLGNHSITEFDYITQQETFILTDKIETGNVNLLSWAASTIISDIELYDNKWLFFHDEQSDPNMINVDIFKSGEYSVYGKDDILIARVAPKENPTASYGNDTNIKYNQLRQNFFQFRTRYRYKDGTRSAWSSMSRMRVPEDETNGIQGDNPTENNKLDVLFDIGDTRVESIDIAVSVNNSDDWFMFKSVNRAEMIAYTDEYREDLYILNKGIVSFYNDTLLIPIDVLETDEPYFDVPLKADSMLLVNGNVLSFGTPTKGYERETESSADVSVSYIQADFNTETEGEGASTLNITFNQHKQDISVTGNTYYRVYLTFSGVPKEGDEIRIAIGPDYGNPTQTLTYIVPETHDGNLAAVISDISQESFGLMRHDAFADMMDDPQIYDVSYGTILRGIIAPDSPEYYRVFSIEIDKTGVTTEISPKSISSLKLNSQYQYARAYKDRYNRRGPLITDDSYIIKTMPYNAVGSGFVPKVDWNISGLAPEWAESMHWYRTDNLTHANTLYVTAHAIVLKGTWDAGDNLPDLNAEVGLLPGWAYEVSVTGEQNLGGGIELYPSGSYVVYDGTNWQSFERDSLGEFDDLIYFRLNSLRKIHSKFPESSLAYDFTPGDRASIANFGGFSIVGLTSFEILGYDPETYTLKGRNIFDEFDTATIQAGTNSILLEIYTPKKTTGEVEDNVFYEIGEPVLVDPETHLHLRTSGTFTEGDVYYRTRNMIKGMNPDETETRLVEDFHFSDMYKSNYHTKGIPHIYSRNDGRKTYKASIAYSMPNVSGSTEIRINEFYALSMYGENEGQTKVSEGRIKKMIQRGDIIFCMQEINIAYIPVYITVIEDNSAQQQIALSTKLFNQAQYARGIKRGIGNMKASCVDVEGTIFFIDPFHSEVVKATIGGIVPISGKKRKFLKNYILASQDNNETVVGLFDSNNNQYILSKLIEPTDALYHKQVLGYSIDDEKWKTFYSYIPEYGVSIKKHFYSFKEGIMYRHDPTEGKCVVYGTTYYPKLKFVSNANSTYTKVFQSVTELGTGVWETPTGGITTQLGQVSELTQEHFLQDTVNGIEIYDVEGKYHTSFRRDKNIDLEDGPWLKGEYLIMEIQPRSDASLFAIIINYIISLNGIR